MGAEGRGPGPEAEEGIAGRLPHGRRHCPKAGPSRAIARTAILAIIAMLLLAILSIPVGSWSNGGWSSDLSRPDLGTHDLVAVAALCTIDSVPALLEDDLAAFLYATELPDRCREGSHSVRFDDLGNVLSAPAVDLVERHALAARVALDRGDGAAAASEAGIACGVLADLAVFAHVIEGEFHHDDHERWVESAVQRGLEDWADVLEPGGLDRMGDRDHTEGGTYLDAKEWFVIYPWDVRPAARATLPEGSGRGGHRAGEGDLGEGGRPEVGRDGGGCGRSGR